MYIILCTASFGKKIKKPAQTDGKKIIYGRKYKFLIMCDVAKRVAMSSTGRRLAIGRLSTRKPNRAK